MNKSDGGEFWNCRSVSVRLKAFQRKASLVSMCCPRDFNCEQRFKSRNPETTTTESPIFTVVTAVQPDKFLSSSLLLKGCERNESEANRG